MRVTARTAIVNSGLAIRIAVGVGIAVVLVIATLVAIPVFFGDRLVSLARTEVNRAVNARVNWTGTGLSLIRDFPNVRLTLNDVSIVNAEPFAGDTLLSVHQARLSLDLGSVVGYLRHGSAVVIREIGFDQPALALRKLADGRANWAITRANPAADTTAARPIGVTLRALRITGGRVSYDDQQSQLTAQIAGLDETLSGDFATDRFTLATRTRADSVSLALGRISYLSHAALDVSANVAADLRAHRFTLANDSLRLNALVLAIGGTITTGTTGTAASPDLGLDLTFSAPSRSFAEILSLVPAIYARDFATLVTSGNMSMSGRVRGTYGPHAFPALALEAHVTNGSFRYPDLALPARDIGLDLAVDNPGGHVDSTVVRLTRFHATIGARPVDARLTVRTPLSDPDIDLRLAGSVDLADVARTVKLTGVSQLTGIVNADVLVRARVSDMSARRYDRVTASGSVQASHVALRADSVPHPITIDTAALRLTPRAAELTAFTGMVGHTDLRATGSLDNLLGFALHDEDLRGSATVTSNAVDLNEWMSKDKATEVIPVPPHIDFALHASAARVSYGALTPTNVRGDLHVKDRRVALSNVRLDMLRGTMVANGYYETVNPAHPAFSMDVTLATLDIPAAFAALNTVQKLAPIAQWAEGSVGGSVSLTGTLDETMTPVFSALTGKGDVTTDRLVLKNAPVLDKLSKSLSMERLASPGIGAVHASFDVSDGRVHVKPFSLTANEVNLTVGGSNGIDQSLDYDLALAVPRALLGAAATSAISRLVAKANHAGATLPPGDVVQLRAHVTGTVTNPTITTTFAGMAASVRDAAQTAAKQMAEAAAENVKQKVDSAAGAARLRARVEAERLVAEAERQADTVRAEARALADRIRREANLRIDSLVSRASNPLAKIAAQKAGDQLKRQADQQAERALTAADARADSLVSQAKQKAAALSPAPPDTSSSAPTA